MSCGPVLPRSMRVMILFTGQFGCFVCQFGCGEFNINVWDVRFLLWDYSDCCNMRCNITQAGRMYYVSEGHPVLIFRLENKQNGMTSQYNCWSQFLSSLPCVYPEYGSSTFFWKFCIYLPICMASHPWRQLFYSMWQEGLIHWRRALYFIMKC